MNKIDTFLISQLKKIKKKYYFEPLEICFNFSKGPMLSYPWINFDGLLAFATGELLFKNKWNSYLSNRILKCWNYLPVPLKKHDFVLKNIKRDFFYHCSISRFSDNSLDSIQFHKFFCNEGYQFLNHSKHKFMIVGGDYKQNKKRYPLRNSRKCYFYCYGDKKEIKILCKNIIGLGKRVSSGNGIVKRFTITSIDKDFSFNHPDFGLNRPIPIIEKELIKNKQLPIANLAYKPPNWIKANHVTCFIPEGFT